MKLRLRKQQLGENQVRTVGTRKPVMRYFSMTGLLVPVLLLSILFVKMVMSDIEQPKAVREAIAKDKASLVRRLSFALYLLENRDARIETEENPSVDAQPAKMVINLKAVNGKFDLQSIHTMAVNLKQKYPEVFKAIVNVTTKISKKEIKMVLESIRKREKTDPEIYLVDEKSGKKILLKVMFTDVIINDKAEG